MCRADAPTLFAKFGELGALIGATRSGEHAASVNAASSVKREARRSMEISWAMCGEAASGNVKVLHGGGLSGDSSRKHMKDRYHAQQTDFMTSHALFFCPAFGAGECPRRRVRAW